VTQETLIQLLADGEFHSGEEAGSLLGVSRTAIWKQFKKLELLGLPLEVQKGRGYRIAGGLDLLDKQKILSLIPESISCASAGFDIFDSIGSTNAVAAEKAQQGGSHGYFCLAEQQTAGRGRRGREWQSPYGRNVYLSMVWEFQSGAAALEGLSLSVGVAVARALSDIGVSSARLKWPNDVLCDNKKLAGILLEMQGDPAGLCQVVVGVGVNVDMGKAQTTGISQPWIDAASIIGRVDRNTFTVTLVSHLWNVLTEFSRRGFAELRDEWSSLDAYKDCEVMVQLGDKWVSGVACGVDSGGGLVLNVDGVRQVFKGGEVSVRSQTP
jgi:BirA family biotin operon repressor/biotin-[acetyl-CoA-carboxylase] ligase